jgi:DNA-binding NarL/FixJ family response regulator
MRFGLSSPTNSAIVRGLYFSASDCGNGREGAQSHWKVYEAENGKVALDRAREIKPDVVIMDIVMPEMSGIEATYEMRRLAPETKVILMSSYYTPEEAAHLARLFGDGNFIPKSEAGKQLVPAISRILPLESQAV